MRAALPALLVLLAGCGRSDAPALTGPPEAPAVVFESAAGPFHLAAHRGRAVVLQFAPGDSVEAWAALAEAHADLEAEGALVVGVSTAGEAPHSPYAVGRDEGAAAAGAFGYRGEPLAIVIDPAGRVRGQVTPRRADDLFALAAPVLLEVEPALGADEPAVVVDLRDGRQRAAEGEIPHALVVAPEDLLAEDLPADLATELVFVGPGSTAAADRAVVWGYDRAHALDDAPPDLALEAVPDAETPAPRRRAAPRVRL